MVEVLEIKVGNVVSKAEISNQRNYVGGVGSESLGKGNNARYSTFAEIFLEKPIDVQAGLTCTSCTWRGVSTIDDW